MTANEEEVAYYRAVEDFFAAARGVPHTLSPRDVQLLRSWWRERVPISAITTAITEVMARRRQRGDDDPAVSLSYCRHAVRRHSKRLSEMRIGEESATPTDAAARVELRSALLRLGLALEEAADRASGEFMRPAEVIRCTGRSLAAMGDLDPAALDEHLYNAEVALLEGCMNMLPETARLEIEERARTAATASGAVGDMWQRAYRAVIDREVRALLGLPRLGLG